MGVNKAYAGVGGSVRVRGRGRRVSLLRRFHRLGTLGAGVFRRVRPSPPPVPPPPVPSRGARASAHRAKTGGSGASASARDLTIGDPGERIHRQVGNTDLVRSCPKGRGDLAVHGLESYGFPLGDLAGITGRDRVNSGPQGLGDKENALRSKGHGTG